MHTDSVAHRRHLSSKRHIIVTAINIVRQAREPGPSSLGAA